MSDEVKFIFKTLIKVPCIIMVAFFILNIFSFFFIYFKALGMSYVVMQTAVENNYLPTTELNQLVKSVNGWTNIKAVQDAGIIVGNTNNDNSIIHNQSEISSKAHVADDARKKKQYGKDVTCGVYCRYQIIWPLDVRAQTKDEKGVVGLSDEKFSGFKSEKDLEKARDKRAGTLDIKIQYTVPGLKYYPDMNIS